MGYIVTCRLLIEAESEGEAADGVNEILREQQRQYAPGSCLIDYAQDAFTPTAIAPDYDEGDAFTGPNLAAAAPAMLAALQMALVALDRSGKERGTRHLEAVAVRNAIAAATGER